MTIDTTKLRELAKKATPGQWELRFFSDKTVVAQEKRRGEFRELLLVVRQPRERHVRNAALIAAANPATVLALLDALDKEKASCVALINWIFDIAEDVGVSKDSDGMIGHGAIADAIFKLNQIKSAALNLAKVRDRHHAEIAYQKLVEVLG